jgi:ABC-type nitrate/sulfonate/bicarbonate transport system substrate-binding protein
MRRWCIAGGTALGTLLLLTSAHVAAALDAAKSPVIELLLGDVSMNKLPFVMALDAGIYERNGLNVTPKFSRGAVEIIRKSGVDVPEQYIQSGGGAPLVKIGGAAPHITRLTMSAGAWDPIILGSTHSTSRWYSVSTADLEKPEDLKGKRIGFSGIGAVTHYMAISFAEQMGWDPDFDWSMLEDALGVEALEAGFVDAIISPELHTTMAVDAGFKVLVDLGDYNLPVAGSAFLFDRAWLAANPDTARRLMKSYVEAIALLKNDKAATFRALGKWFQISDPDLLEHFYREAEKLPSKPYPPYAGLKKVMQIYDSHEMRKYTVEHFYDDSIMKELDESGYIDSLYD